MLTTAGVRPALGVSSEDSMVATTSDRRGDGAGMLRYSVGTSDNARLRLSIFTALRCSSTSHHLSHHTLSVSAAPALISPSTLSESHRSHHRPWTSLQN